MIDDDPPLGRLGERVAGVSERREQRVLGVDDRSGACRIAGLQRKRRRGWIGWHSEHSAVGPANLQRGNAIQRPRGGRDGDLCRIGAGIDLIKELGIPVAKAVRGVLEPIEIVFGAAAQCFLGGGEAIIERLQL